MKISEVPLQLTKMAHFSQSVAIQNGANEAKHLNTQDLIHKLLRPKTAFQIISFTVSQVRNICSAAELELQLPGYLIIYYTNLQMADWKNVVMKRPVKNGS